MKTTRTYGATLLDVMGNDLTVVNAARVSFDKQHDAFEYMQDAKLIAYLARHRHWTPFAHPQLSFRVSAPIFVARQLQKHQIGLAWNEVSRRYVSDEPTIFIPDGWRAAAKNVKQGSCDDLVTTMHDGGFDPWYYPSEAAASVARQCAQLYEAMLVSGICPEQARMVLPQSMMTEWVWTGSLYAFANVCNQRLDPHAQRECKPVAEAIAKALTDNFPVSWAALSR